MHAKAKCWTSTHLVQSLLWVSANVAKGPEAEVACSPKLPLDSTWIAAAKHSQHRRDPTTSTPLKSAFKDKAMGAPIWINNNKDLWISNGMKDAFCRVLTTVATLEGHDVIAVYTDEPGVAGTYGVSGMGIDLDEFNAYLGGPEGVRRHLDVCRARLPEVAESCGLAPTDAGYMLNLFAWAAYIMDGHPLPENCNYYLDWPPGIGV